MKKLFIVIFCLLFLQIYTQRAEAVLCEVTESKFEPFTLHGQNEKGQKYWELQKDNSWPKVDLVFTTKNCKEKGSLKVKLFSFGFDSQNKSLTPRASSLFQVEYPVKEDGQQRLSIDVGTNRCSAYFYTNLLNSNFITKSISYVTILPQGLDYIFGNNEQVCRYLAGFQDDVLGLDGNNGGKSTRWFSNFAQAPDFHFPNIDKIDSMGDDEWYKNYGLTYSCNSATTCGKYNTKPSNESLSQGIKFNTKASFNDGFSSDGCKDNEKDCYTLLSDVPLPIVSVSGADGKEFSINHTELSVNNSNETIKKTIIKGIAPYNYIMDNFVALFIWLVIIMAVLRLMYIGYIRITTDSAKNKTDTRTDFLNVFIGLGICFSFYVILNTINPDLLIGSNALQKQLLESLGDIPKKAVYKETLKNKDISSGKLNDVKISKLTSGAVWFVSGMNIDTDGDYNSYTAEEKALVKKYDRSHQSMTSYSFPKGGKYFNAFRFPYIVLPPAISQKYDLVLGDIAAVTYNGKTAYAIYADNGPADKIGEGSVYLVQQLDPGHTNLNSALPGNVSYTVFPHSKIPDLSEQNAITRIIEKGIPLFQNAKSPR